MSRLPLIRIVDFLFLFFLISNQFLNKDRKKWYFDVYFDLIVRVHESLSSLNLHTGDVRRIFDQITRSLNNNHPCL